MSKKSLLLNSILAATFLVCSCGNVQPEQQNSTVTNEVQNETPTTESKSESALSFLNAYVDNCNLMSESIGVIDWVNASDLVTSDFKSELQKLMDEAYAADPELGLGADPIFNAQDWPEEGFELDTTDDKANLITAKGINWPDFKVTVKVIEENGIWMVDGCGMVNMKD
jgi:hypothetical protein